MSNLIYRTADKCLHGQPSAFVTSGAFGVDRISVELDETWTGLGGENIEYSLSICRPGEYENAGEIVLNEREGDIVSRNIPYDVTAKAGEWELGLIARDTFKGELLKTSTTVPLIIEQGAPLGDTYIRDWNEIRQELIYAMNNNLDTSLTDDADADAILAAIESNPKTQTVAAWDKLFAESPLDPTIFGRTDNRTNSFWNGILPYLNTVNLTDATNFFRGNNHLEEVSLNAKNVTSFNNTFNMVYAGYPYASIKKITIKELSSQVVNYSGCFSGQSKLKEIDADINFTSCENTGEISSEYSAMFVNCVKLQSVRFIPDTLSVDLSLADCSELKKDSVISALRACKQLETAGSAVLAFNTAVYSADLMPEIETAVAKGFKVTFGNKIFGGTGE